MTPMQYFKRLVLLAFIIKVTSHPTPYGSRLINFLDNGSGGGGGGGRRVSSGNYNNNNDDNDRRHHHQKNVETGSDSSLVEISFQPLRELESVTAPPSSLYPLTGKQFLDEDLRPRPPAPVPNLSAAVVASAALSRNQRNFHRLHYQPLEVEQLRHHQRQRYPDESYLNEGTTMAFSSSPAVNGLNEISYPDEADDEVPFDFLRSDLQSRTSSATTSEEESQEQKGGPPSKENYAWNVSKRQQHPLSFGPTEGQRLFSYMGDDSNNKRNALAAFKRQKFKSHQTQFIPSISVGAMTNLGDFFKNLKNNLEYMEKGRLSGTEEQLLEGDHPITMLREELTSDGIRPTGTAAFLHAIRTYRPSQRIRSLVALNPEGYHGSQFLDPNYMWVGLGKRK